MRTTTSTMAQEDGLLLVRRISVVPHNNMTAGSDLGPLSLFEESFDDRHGAGTQKRENEGRKCVLGVRVQKLCFSV
jgi:hypothetical protein